MSTRTSETVSSRSSPTPPQPPRKLPPLESGDRLDRVEFERRYDAMANLKKAELIDGVVYVPSPVNHERHGKPHFRVIGWLDRFLEATPGVEGGDNSSLRLNLGNMPQPDAFLYVLPSHGGQIRIDKDGYIEAAPELVVEVASTSASHDLHSKLDVYLRVGVREYIVWRVDDGAIDWFVVRNGRLARLEPTPEGLYQSEVFPGLWLDPAALIRGDRMALAHTVRRGLATPEHADFVARLAREAGTPS